ncbi:sensor histidine kinase [Dubosiella newyorkensis]|nr:ATP-binding protein [Dubosiella newyorkensis]
MAQGIYQEASWLYSLVENILNLTRMEEGHLILNKQEALAEEIIEAACSTVEKRNKDRTIQVNIPSEIITVDVDEKLIVQLLVNLLENAIRHTPQENKVEIVLEADPIKKEVRFIVQDEGEGIGKEDLPHIFEPFYTSSQNQKDRARGIGLGLAICRSIAQAHDGELTAHNRCDRSGARFICTLLMTERKDLS